MIEGGEVNCNYRLDIVCFIYLYLYILLNYDMVSSNKIHMHVNKRKIMITVFAQDV